MFRAWLLGAVAALASYTGAQAQAQATNAIYVSDLSYLNRPDSDDFSKYFPHSKIWGSAFGALIECRVAAKGALEVCLALATTDEARDIQRPLAGVQKLYSYNVQARPNAVGNFIIFPIMFLGYDAQNTNIEALSFGPTAYTITDRPEGAAMTAPCAGGKTCYLQPFAWAATPSFASFGHSFLKLEQTVGTSVVSCTVDANGELTNCSKPKNLLESQQATLQALNEQFLAPAATRIGTPVHGRQVVLSYDWAALAKAINASALVKLR